MLFLSLHWFLRPCLGRVRVWCCRLWRCGVPLRSFLCFLIASGSVLPCGPRCSCLAELPPISRLGLLERRGGRVGSRLGWRLLSTFAVILLVYVKSSMVCSEKPNFSPAVAMSLGVFRLVLPFPPQTAIPCSCGDNAPLRMPVTTVVTPLLCQS